MSWRRMGGGGGLEVQLYLFLTSVLDGAEWSALRPGRFTPGTHWMSVAGLTLQSVSLKHWTCAEGDNVNRTVQMDLCCGSANFITSFKLYCSSQLKINPERRSITLSLSWYFRNCNQITSCSITWVSAVVTFEVGVEFAVNLTSSAVNMKLAALLTN